MERQRSLEASGRFPSRKINECRPHKKTPSLIGNISEPPINHLFSGGHVSFLGSTFPETNNEFTPENGGVQEIPNLESPSFLGASC